MKKKEFYLKAEQIKPLVPNMGGCLATDMITVKGEPVRFMYREEPSNEIDSGWRFTAGMEDSEYMEDPDNSDIYGVNTIANYDKDIIPFLNAPYGTAWERDYDTGEFVEVEFEDPED